MNTCQSLACRSHSQLQQPLAEVSQQLALPQFAVKIAAGFPAPASDDIEESLDIGRYLIRHQASTFIFTVEGNSMTGAHIFDGDKLIVDRSITPRHGHIVVAVIDAEFTVKRLHHFAGVTELRPENPAYPPIRCNDGEDIQIWGVATGVIRKLAI